MHPGLAIVQSKDRESGYDFTKKPAPISYPDEDDRQTIVDLVHHN